MGFKELKPSPVDNRYVVSRKFPHPIKYQLRNGQVIIDLKEIIDGILDKEGIAKYKTMKMTMNIPYNLKNEVSGNTVNMVIDKRRFLINLSDLEIIRTKQQKIDYDNTHAHRWKIPQWIKFIEDLHFQSYGLKPVELDYRGQFGGIRRAKSYSQVSILIGKLMNIESFKVTEKDVMEYIRWVFTFKSKKTLVTVGFLTSDGLIQEWIHSRISSSKSVEGKKVRKWD